MKRTEARTDLLILLALFAVAALVRAVYLWQSSANPTFLLPIVDARGYHQRACELARAGSLGEPFLWQPIFYPLFLAGVYVLAGPSILVAKIVQALLGCLTVLLTYHLGRVVLGRTAGVIAGLIVALYGPLIFFETELVASGWAAFFSVALLWLLLRAARRQDYRTHLALGACGGLSILAQTTFLAFCVPAFIWLAARLKQRGARWRRAWPRLVCVLAGVLAVWIPVSVLTVGKTGHLAILPAAGGINLYIGNNPYFPKTLTIRPGYYWQMLTALPAREGHPGDQWSDQRYFLAKVGRYVRERPLDYLDGLGQKVLHLLSSREIPRNVDVYVFRRWSPLLRALVWKWGKFGFPFGVVLPLACVGLLASWRRIPVPIKLLVGLYAAGIVLVFVSARYRVVLVPLLAILAAEGSLGIWRLARARSWGRLGPVTAGLAVITLLSVAPGPFAQEKLDAEAEIYFGVGYDHYAAGDWEPAAECFRLALSRNDSLPEVYYFLGATLLKQGAPEAALQQLEMAIRLDRAYEPAYPARDEARRQLARRNLEAGAKRE